ncbi:hypothetical protein [Streptomyces sp. NPDC101455]|uniref:hypothetical protein n=1 Tax=Streptomyces sp. NPDC101455 TaxID=3366142 RepID=UPI0037F1DD0A
MRGVQTANFRTVPGLFSGRVTSRPKDISGNTSRGTALTPSPAEIMPAAAHCWTA